jgi:hypothetical protein
VVAIVSALAVGACSDTTRTFSPWQSPSANASASAGDPGLLPGESPAVVAGPDLGEAWTTEPDPDQMATLDDGSQVAADQLLVMLDPSSTRADADRIAATVHGTVGGHVAYIGLWKLLVEPIYRPDVIDARLTMLASQQGVLAAAPVGLESVDAAPDCAPALSDKVYSGSTSKSYDMIHVAKAWTALYASGLPLSPVHVGFLDTVLTHDPKARIPWEFGDVTFVGGAKTTPDPRPVTSTDPRTDGFNHADGTLGILAGSGQNGGIAGIASPLGSRLIISQDVLDSPEKVPSKWSARDGTSYTDANLIKTLREIESGATIINGSWGGFYTNARGAAMWKKFVTQMAKDHPNVLFVFAAGNDGKALNGSNYFPGGIASGNVITVGNLDNDGTPDSTTNTELAGGAGEVTLGAPGEQAVWGRGADGKVRADGGGTSSATPMVSATAALIRSIDPNLSAAEIKGIISKSAGNGDAGLGGKTLRVDLAVREAIDGARAKLQPPKPPLTDAEIAAATQYCSIDLTSELKERLMPDGASRWQVRGSLQATPGPTVMTLIVKGTRNPDWRQPVTAPAAAVTWQVLVPKEGTWVVITRLDNGFWLKRTLSDQGAATPTPTASPPPTPTPSGYDCNNSPVDPIEYNRWYLHCKPIGG